MDREDVRKAIKRDLSSDAFNEILTEVWAEKGYDTDEVERAVEIHATMRMSPQQFPCGEVAIGTGRIDNPDQSNAEYNYQVTIFWHANGSDEELLEDVLDRFVRATQDFYKARPQLAGGAVVWLGDNDASPLIDWGQEARPYIKSMAQELYVKVIR